MAQKEDLYSSETRRTRTRTEMQSNSDHKHHIEDIIDSSNIPRVESVSSISSLSSYHSSTTNHHEIFENVANENVSTHSFCTDHLQHHTSIHSANDQISICSMGITPSPKRTSPTSSPNRNNKNKNNKINTNSNNNANHGAMNNNNNNNISPASPPMVSNILSPHITALTKLHTNNLNNNNNDNKELSPSPRNQQQIEHQDLKYHGHDDNELNEEWNNSEQQDKVWTLTSLSCSQTTTLNKPSITSSSSSITSIKNAFWSSLQSVNNYVRSNNDNHNDNDNDDDKDPNLTDNGRYDDDEKKDDEYQSGSMSNDDEHRQNADDSYNVHNNNNSFESIMRSPMFMENAFTMYGQLDHALTNINNLKSQQMQSLKQRRKRKHENTSENDEHDNGHKRKKKKRINKEDKHDVNEQVVDVMKTLISSTTEMGSFFSASTQNNNTSLIGGLLDKLSSSIAYMSYISVSHITPFIYNMVEAVLVELYETIKDIIEYYDSDPKNNILYRIINKMNEIIEAIRGLLALSDCFYEISSDHDESDNDDHDDYDDANNNHSYPSYSLSFNNNNKKKEKKD